MTAKTITVTVVVVLLVVVIAVLLMKINKDSKQVDALISESMVKRMANPPIARSTVMPPDPTIRLIKKAEAPTDDIENVGDQSLMLDEDPSQEYDEMAEETGILKIATPQPDENWVNSRQVQPVKDLSVGIAITNDVSKQDNLQAGKITSKFPVTKGPAVVSPEFAHKGPQGEPTYFEAMRTAAAKASRERDAKARSMVDKRARSMAESAEMQARKRVNTGQLEQLSFGNGRATVPVAKSIALENLVEAEQASSKMARKMQAEQVEMMARKMQAEQLEMKAAKMVKKVEAEQVDMMAMKKAMKVEAEQAEMMAMKKAMKAEGYETMEPRGYAIRV
tara:strand:+ start:407 stop:1411 length:1005 start_codon:yes stop_codon:yes gene_type:complete